MNRLCIVGAFALFGCAAEPSPLADLEVDRANSAAATWVPVTEATDAALLEASAQVVVPPGAVAEVATTYRLHIDRVVVRPGDVVSTGDVLLEATAPDLVEAVAARRAADVQAKVLRARLDRLEALRKDGLVEQARLFELEVALAEVDAQRLQAAAVLRGAGVDGPEIGRLSRSGTVVLTSPIDGTVRGVDAVVGQVREPGSGALISIVGAGDVRIEARMAGSVPKHTRFEFVGSDGSMLDLGEGEPQTLIVPEDGTVLAWWDPPTVEHMLVPGLRGRVRGRVAQAGVVQVPAAALQIDRQGQPMVLVQSSDEKSVPVPVDVIASSGASALVRGALKVGTKVAADASQVLAAPSEGAE